MGLLLATAAAFAITEHLKLEKSPIGGITVSRYLAPGCSCENAKATVGVKLRHANTVTVRILDAANQTVATLATNQAAPKGHVGWKWGGRTDLGGRAPDGRYWPEIALPNHKFLLPDAINLDTKAPLVHSVSLRPALISPNGDGIADQVKIRYRLSERGHLIVWHGSQVLLRTRSAQTEDKTTWKGRTAGTPWRAGTYTLTVGAEDLAGNTTPPAQRKQLTIVVRYVVLGRTRIAVRPRRRFAVRVQADAAPYTWTLGHRHGTSRRPVLRLRAPKQSGRYRLRVTQAGHSASALVVVR